MGHYRQGNLSEAAAELNRAIDSNSESPSLLARVFLAMTVCRQGDLDSAGQHLRLAERGLGLAALVDLQSPFSLHHDDLAAWLALQEAREMICPDTMKCGETIDRLLETQRKLVKESPEDTRRSLHLAVLYAWFERPAEHRELCQRLLALAETSQDPTDLERAAKAYLIYPAAAPDLLASAAASAGKAVDCWQRNDRLRPWAELAAGIAAYRQQQYAEAIHLLTAAQQSDNRLIRGPALLYRSITHLRRDEPRQAEADFASAEGLVRHLPDETQLTEHLLFHDGLVSWLAYDEAKQEFASASQEH
jgi:tetratricopeptide (TPR) repeat protein